jgi:hypothetical protein
MPTGRSVTSHRGKESTGGGHQDIRGACRLFRRRYREGITRRLFAPLMYRRLALHGSGTCGGNRDATGTRRS